MTVSDRVAGGGATNDSCAPTVDESSYATCGGRKPNPQSDVNSDCVRDSESRIVEDATPACLFNIRNIPDADLQQIHDIRIVRIDTNTFRTIKRIKLFIDQMPCRPSFDDLPYRKGDPPFSAWGLYGENDQLGALNLLTPETTLAAAKDEIQTGIRLSLDPQVNSLLQPTHGRQGLKHTIFRRGENRPVHDDILEFNTQVRLPRFKRFHMI